VDTTSSVETTETQDLKPVNEEVVDVSKAQGKKRLDMPGAQGVDTQTQTDQVVDRKEKVSN
jgi:hypothetical protein